MVGAAICGSAMAINPVNPVMSSLKAGSEQAPVQRRAFGALKSSPLRATSSDEVRELYISQYNSDWVHYEYSGDWYCTFMGEIDGDKYDFHVDIYADDLVGHFTEADLDGYYTWCRKNDVEFTFAQADINITPSSVEGQYDLDMTVKTTLDETLHVVVSPNPPSMDDIHVEGKILSSAYFYGPDWSVGFEGFDDYYVLLDFENPEVPGQLEGVYSTENFWLEYCNFRNMQTGKENAFVELNMTVAGNDLQNDIEMTGSGVLDNGVNVTFHYLKTPPMEPTQTIALDATITHLRFTDPTASRNTTLVALSNDGTREIKVAYDGVKGTFEQFNLMHTLLTYVDSGETFELDHGMLTLSVNKQNVVTVEAELVFKDSICYTFVADYQIEVLAEKLVEVHNMTITNLFGLINYMIGSNDEYTRVQASTFYELVEGDYTDDMVFVLEAANGTSCSSLTVKEATLTKTAGDQLALYAQFLGDDMVDYTLTMDFFVPEVTGEATFASTTAKLRDLTIDYGAFQIMGEDESKNDYFSIVLDDFYVHSAHYSSLSTVNMDYCQIIRNLGKENQEILPMYTCNLDLTVSGRDFTLTGTCQAGTILYTVNISGKFEEEVDPVQGDPNDDPDLDLDLVFELEDVTRFDVMPEYGYTVMTMQNANGEQFSTLIYMEGETLSEGVYEINNSYAPGSVQAGMVSGTTAYPTIFIQYDEWGNGTLPVWLFVEGTVTVSYVEGEISLVVDANNTWGRHASVVLNPGSSVAIDSVKSEAKTNGKFWTNEGVVIRHEGREYNSFGLMK